jgi:hypothetical protein
MTSPGENLWVRPLFYDALSGEFHPSGDLAKKAHTVGRLAVATFKKGTRSYDTTVGFGSIRGEQLHYRPSWSPITDATILCTMRGQRPELSGIALRDDYGSTLVVKDTSEEQVQARLITIEGFSIDLALELGEELDHARSLITQTARDFFG